MAVIIRWFMVYIGSVSDVVGIMLIMCTLYTTLYTALYTSDYSVQSTVLPAQTGLGM